MIAYKFLRAGRIGAFSNFAWPDPGIWVRTGAATDPCSRGIHACRPCDLPWWLADELWEVELGGTPQIHEHKIVARAGALRSQIHGWTAGCAQEYGEACAWRARDVACDALSRAGHRRAAAGLAQCTTLDDVLVTARRLANDLPDSRISLTITGDGAFRALSGAPPTAAYIAAHAALRVHGSQGYAAERARQSSWLVSRLGLRANA
ncbi:MAG: hypothetical protein ACJ780_10980 [Solirubrobacteraceae bacterium]